MQGFNGPWVLIHSDLVGLCSDLVAHGFSDLVAHGYFFNRTNPRVVLPGKAQRRYDNVT